MTLWSDVIALARQPRQLFVEQLAQAPALQQLIVGTALPLVAIRPAAVAVKSLALGNPTVAFVLGVSSLALQIGAWIGLVLLLPPIVRQFRGDLSPRQAMQLAVYASAPMWIAGVVYLLPEEPALVYAWSRALMVAAAIYGGYLLYVALGELAIPSRHLVVGATAAAYVTLYMVLFALLGLSSHLMLYLLGGLH